VNLVNPYILQSGIDADVQAFLTATGITDGTITTALVNLVASLKGNGLWTKLIGIYPIVGGTATTHKYNLKDARDLDAAFRLTWHGSQTHDASGVVGTSGSDYADTHLIPSSDIPANEGSIGAWVSGFNFSGFGVNNTLGCRTTGNKQFLFAPEWSDGNCYYSANGAGSSISYSTFTGVTVDAFCQNARKDATDAYFQISTTRVSYSGAYDPPNINAYLMGENFNGTPSFFSGSSRKFKFFYIGKAMTTTDMDNFNTAAIAFQSDLGR
jgi:hypothetical protein